EELVEAQGCALRGGPGDAIGTTAGGAVNSGSSGLGAPRGGSLCDAIAFLKVVLPDGTILKTASEADADGHLANLTPLFFGAEGNLGVFKEATLSIVPNPDATKSVAYTFPS